MPLPVLEASGYARPSRMETRLQGLARSSGRVRYNPAMQPLSSYRGLWAGLILCGSVALGACQSSSHPAQEFHTEVAAGPQFWVPVGGQWPSLAFDVRGEPGGGPTYVFVHGWCENRRFWSPLLHELETAQPEAQAWVVDLPGHGDSEAHGGAMDPEAIAQGLSAWVRAQGLESIVLVGHNYGATVAVEMARELQDDREVQGVVVFHALYDPSQAYEPSALEPFARALEANFSHEMGAFSSAMLSEQATAPVRRFVQEQMGAAQPRPAVALLRGLGGFDLRPALKELRMPVRAINGAFRPTRKTSAQAFVQDFDVTVLPDLPGPGFAPMIHDPAASCAALVAYARAFRDEVNAATAAPADPQTP